MRIAAQGWRRVLGLSALVAALLAPVVAFNVDLRRAAPAASTMSVASLLGDSGNAGFARATTVRPFVFPRDHGAHPAYRSEWWYFTGNLADSAGRRFGYELTFFRFGLAPGPSPEGSAWATHQAWMVHFAVTDVAGRRFEAFQRLERGALGLAGARAAPFAVWLDDWSVHGAADPACWGCLTLKLEAANDRAGIALELRSTKPAVLEGDRGLSQKNALPGNASYYYSLTRLASAGTLRIGSETFTVTGNSWLDREWSSSALGPEQTGWDWFALQLDDGQDLMFYRLRRRDGRPDPFSRGTLVARNGTSVTLAADDVEITVLGHWRSPHSHVRYPSGWRLRAVKQGLDLKITPLLKDQELNLSVRYWEGACRIEGTAGGQPVAGYGYVELAGYGAGPPPR